MNRFPKVLTSIRDLERTQIDQILERAKSFKNASFNRYPFFLDNKKLDKYRQVIIATNFLENSTRTKLSFMRAIDNLGAKHLNFETISSSIKKGESLEDTFLTLKSLGVEICVFRTGKSGDLNRFKSEPPFYLINAGDGMNQHPTQALLDLMTITEMGINPKDKTVAIVGDCNHSRVCHSLIDLLTMYQAKIILTGPSGCVPDEHPLPNVQIFKSIDEAIKVCDILYLLRIQNERHITFGATDFFSDYHQRFGINMDRLKRLKKMPPVFHPGPANIGAEISNDIIRSKLYQGNNQVINSIYIRMSILDMMIEQIISDGER